MTPVFSWLKPFLVLNLLLVALMLPRFPAMPWIALEALLLVWFLWLLPTARLRRIAIAIAAVPFALLALIAAGETLIRQSLGRSFNVYLEWGLLAPGFNLMSSNLGLTAATALAFVAVTTLAGLVWLFCRVLAHPGLLTHRPRKRSWILAIPVVALLLTWLPQTPVAPTASAMIAQQWSLARATHVSNQEFQQHIRRQLHENRAFAGQAAPLPGLEQQDVLMGFIESYGLSALTDDRYRPVIEPRLESMARAFEAAGLHVVSGRLQSPIQGGQSWLGHASVLSGLWVANQLDYEVLLNSGYPTLIDDLQLTGHQAIAVMPAITMNWPEGRLLGYDRIFDAHTMDYQGPELNWVTMPDQYTWSWFEKRIRTGKEQPLFAELSLISSHAPWVPILPVLDDWNSIGDGEVFMEWKGAGETPASLWQDHDRVREHYARAIDYALAVATDYAVRHVDHNTLLILLGDHQPAPLITGEDASRDVIVHVISANPTLLETFVSRMGGLPSFRRGTLPDTTTAGARMDALRPFLHQHFGG